jgi:hypothetical protein
MGTDPSGFGRRSGGASVAVTHALAGLAIGADG